MFTQRAQALIELAKDWAFTEAKDALDIESLLAAVGADAEACVRLAECLCRGDVNDLRRRCPDFGQPASCPGMLDLSGPLRAIVVSAMGLASGEGVPDRTHPGLANLSHLVCAIAMSRDVCRVLGGLKPVSREEALRILAAWQDEESGRSSIAGLVSQLRAMRTELLSKIFGQDHAIHAFVEGLHNAEVTAAADRERERPSAVFVFAGPPGVGKTYMSELCAAHLGRPFKRFDMTGYSDHQAHMQLVGFPESYKGAQPGALTGFVEKNPNAFLLFDEIEKAHLNTVQFFYQILDAGRLEDKFTGHDVSFRDTVIMFTTNAGRSLYDNPNKAGIGAANSSYHKRTILSALENEKNPTNGQPAFPPAICSRLAQGYPVMFNHLGINELERVGAAELARTEALLKSQYFKNFEHDPLIPISLVLREGGRVDARQLRAETEKFVKGELYKFANLYSAERLEDVFEGIDSIRFMMASKTAELDPKIRALYESIDRPKVLLVANSRFVGLCREHVPEMNWFAAMTPDEVTDILTTEEIDLILIDIWVRRSLDTCAGAPVPDDLMKTVDQGQDFVPFSARALHEGRDILHKVQDRFPNVPVYLLSLSARTSTPGENSEASRLDRMMQTISIDAAHAPEAPVTGGEPERRAIDDELFLACVRAGGARGLIATDFGDTSQSEWQTMRDRFAESLAETTQRLYREKKAKSLAQERKTLVFETAAELDHTARQLNIRLRNFQLGRAIEASDAGEIIEEIQRPHTKLDDVLGATAAKEALKFLVDWLRDPKRYRAMGIRPPKGILLAGPPGTGKTMLARAVAGESNCAFIEKSASSFVTVWQGSGPQNMRDLFERARRYAPAIVFIDEIDAIGVVRGGGMGGARAQEETLNAMLTEMDGFGAPSQHPVIVLAATNLADRLDEALKRRFDRTIEVDRPDKAARLKYLEQAMGKRRGSEVSDAVLQRLAGQTAGMTIADLERIVHEAAVMAVQQNGTLSGSLLEEAFEKARMGEAGERPDQKTLERIARHEAGHALIAWRGGNLPVQVTIVGRGGTGGFMERESDELRIIYTKPELEQRIREIMGGRAAELLYYGKDAGLSSGASGDLRQATDLASRMICEYGMDEEFGHVSLPMSNRPDQREGLLAADIRKAAQRLVKQQLQAAMALLEEERTNLDRLADSLIDRNRLSREELAGILR